MMVHLLPGDPAAMMLDVRATPERVQELRESMGLDRPLPVQYFEFITGAIRGDLGRSFRSGRPVVTEIQRRLWPTLQLAFSGIGLALVFGVITGTLSAAKRDTWLEAIIMIIAMIGISMPNFVLGMLIILIFSLRLGWLPMMGYGSLINLIAPAICLGFLYAAIMARLIRSSMIEVLSMDYIRTAKSKGLSQRVVFLKHALKNGLIPVITIAGLYLGVLLGGTVVIEELFTWPGMGRLAVNAIAARDYPVVQGVILYIATGFVIINLLVDLSYGFLDPRIKYE